jgi:hypothetical protein
MAESRRRIGAGPVDNVGAFRPGQDARRHGGGRPPGARNRRTNLFVAGVEGAILKWGEQYAKQRGVAAAECCDDVDKFEQFMLYVIEKDLKAFMAFASRMVPKDVRLSVQQQSLNMTLNSDQARHLLAERGLRLPEQFCLSAGHVNEDDSVSEAGIAAVLDRS